MSGRNPENWMNGIIGPDTVLIDGARISPARKSINFVGATQEDDPDNNRTNVTTGGGDGGDGGAVVFDPDATSGNLVRHPESSDPSPINNASAGIVNLGSGAGDGATGATNSYATIGGGLNQSVSGLAGTVSGGQVNSATGANAFVPGGYCAVASRHGQMAHADGYFDAPGDAQGIVCVLRGESENGAAVRLQFDDGADFAIDIGRAYSIQANCIAWNGSNGDIASFIYTLQVKRFGAGASVLVQAIDSTPSELLNTTTWTLEFTVVSNTLRATFTGESGQTVRAVLRLSGPEVGG